MLFPGQHGADKLAIGKLFPGQHRADKLAIEVFIFEVSIPAITTTLCHCAIAR